MIEIDYNRREPVLFGDIDLRDGFFLHAQMGDIEKIGLWRKVFCRNGFNAACMANGDRDVVPDDLRVVPVDVKISILGISDQ